MSNGRPWQADETSKLRRLNAAGMTDGEIAMELGNNRTRGQVQRKRDELKLKPGQSGVFTAMMCRINYRRMARV